MINRLLPTTLPCQTIKCNLYRKAALKACNKASLHKYNIVKF
ncbi:hypothetical protein [Aneurinibacillus migulanus]|nr:hypothetical protein [Aneurinibacillus migulanus]